MNIREQMAKWGKLGGKARAAKLSKERRSEIARLGGKTASKNFKARAKASDPS